MVRTDSGARPEPTEGKGPQEDDISALARMFFNAATKLSENSEDILPQEDSESMRYSVFSCFAELFPEAVGLEGTGAGGNKRMRLHFNQVGYSFYGKEQSRRVPAVRAKPGNPGYGFRRARWRDTLKDAADMKHCEEVLREGGCEDDKIEAIKARVQELGSKWDSIRRPSRPAGPGRPRRAVVPTSTSSAKKENGVDQKSTGTNGSQIPMPSLVVDEELVIKRPKQALKPTKPAPVPAPTLRAPASDKTRAGGKRAREDEARKTVEAEKVEIDDLMLPALKYPKLDVTVLGESSSSRVAKKGTAGHWDSGKATPVASDGGGEVGFLDNLELFASIAAAQHRNLASTKEVQG
mmetsp:Transcript_61285/g.150808  ORF Transcript_61285/g.150808 Transcript_61285/m.150808 type:complete len:351 (+) Transcript_61285:157-1209(+)